MLTLITGGVKSGKSSFALELAREWQGEAHFIATATASDEEMRAKIRRHQEERAKLHDGPRFITSEAPLRIDGAARTAGSHMILDCITLWMANVYAHSPRPAWEPILDGFIAAAAGRGGVIVVTNEVGLGNIPMDPLSRAYNESLGNANTRLAQAADEVYLLIAGIPMKMKG